MRDELVKILSGKSYVDCSPDHLKNALGLRQFNDEGANSIYFHKFNTNQPSMEKAYWILNGMQEAGQLEGITTPLDRIAESIFAPEYFTKAKSVVQQN